MAPPAGRSAGVSQCAIAWTAAAGRRTAADDGQLHRQQRRQPQRRVLCRGQRRQHRSQPHRQLPARQDAAHAHRRRQRDARRASNDWQKAQNDARLHLGRLHRRRLRLCWGYQFYFGPDPNGQAYQTFLASRSAAVDAAAGRRAHGHLLPARPRRATSPATGQRLGDPLHLPLRRHAAGEPQQRGHPRRWRRQRYLAAHHQHGRTSPGPPPTTKAPASRATRSTGGPIPTGPAPASSRPASTSRRRPSAAPTSACTGYLRLRSRDNVANEAENWTTGFVLRYDNTPPDRRLHLQRRRHPDHQTLVTLYIDASDLDDGSGQRRAGDAPLRRRPDWTPWEVYASERPVDHPRHQPASRGRSTCRCATAWAWSRRSSRTQSTWTSTPSSRARPATACSTTP